MGPFNSFSLNPCNVLFTCDKICEDFVGSALSKISTNLKYWGISKISNQI